MAIFYFSDVLRKVGLDPSKVKLIRHEMCIRDRAAVEGGCAVSGFIVRPFQNVLLPRVSDNQYFQVYCTSAPPLC